ncbi:hypothetical protein DSO57_1036040 [Entomophthora muscae]|uniref:Uncharacterized protein n=1 Tax=Entomophthora muscae TaxID=34485 RepID=A0ACC2RQJ3_9FUNG|nr:hypothetical protein DSO57_1036040 [Entomophthora muscae]
MATTNLLNIQPSPNLVPSNILFNISRMVGLIIHFVRIANSSSLETQAWEQESNPEPGFLWAAGPVDCGTACPRFSGIKLPQADTERINPCSKKRQSKEIIAPNGGLITAPNGGTDLSTISFINLKSTPATNQEPTQERGTGPQPGPMTSTLKLDDQAAKSRIWTNERTPRLSAILLPLDPSTQFPRPWHSQCPDEPPIENVKFRGGYYIDPRTPRSKLITIFEKKVILRSPGPPAPPPAVFCPSGVPFGAVHFTEDSLRPKYKDFPPENVLELDPLAHIQSDIRYN